MHPIGFVRRAVAAIGCAAVMVTLGAGPLLANAPTVSSVSFHRDGPFISCPALDLYGSWDIVRKVSVFTDSSGTPVRDIWHVTFNGRVYNPTNGAWVPDRGTREFHDTLAPDGSITATIFTFQRTDPFVHEAGQIRFGPSDAAGDQVVLRQVGHDGFTDANIAAICTALGGD